MTLSWESPTPEASAARALPPACTASDRPDPGSSAVCPVPAFRLAPPLAFLAERLMMMTTTTATKPRATQLAILA